MEVAIPSEIRPLCAELLKTARSIGYSPTHRITKSEMIRAASFEVSPSPIRWGLRLANAREPQLGSYVRDLLVELEANLKSFRDRLAKRHTAVQLEAIREELSWVLSMAATEIEGLWLSQHDALPAGSFIDSWQAYKDYGVTSEMIRTRMSRQKAREVPALLVGHLIPCPDSGREKWVVREDTIPLAFAKHLASRRRGKRHKPISRHGAS